MRLAGIVKGEGSDLTNLKRLKNCARRKLINQSILLELIDYSIEKGDHDQAQCYWNTYHCFERIVSGEGLLYGEYCKNRFCSICCGIRKAQLINSYMPTMKNWEEPFFLTLTVKAVTAPNLKARIDEMFILLNRIIARYRKQESRGKGFRLIGIKSFECNYNPEKKTYNPHFHIILKNLKIADTLRSAWIKEGRKLWGMKSITSVAQLNKRVFNLETCLIEVIKYSTKIFTAPEGDEIKKNKERSVSVYVEAYDTIINAMKGRRVFDRFGFNLPPRPAKKLQVKKLTCYKEWFYLPEFSDWLEIEGTLSLTGYYAEESFREFLKSAIIKASG